MIPLISHIQPMTDLLILFPQTLIHILLPSFTYSTPSFCTSLFLDLANVVLRSASAYSLSSPISLVQSCHNIPFKLKVYVILLFNNLQWLSIFQKTKYKILSLVVMTILILVPNLSRFISLLPLDIPHFTQTG